MSKGSLVGMVCHPFICITRSLVSWDKSRRFNVARNGDLIGVFIDVSGVWFTFQAGLPPWKGGQQKYWLFPRFFPFHCGMALKGELPPCGCGLQQG